LARKHGHRLTFHPSEFTKIASDRPEVVDTSVKELVVHSKIFDLMGFLPPTHYNKINIHVGGVYGDKDATLKRFADVFSTRLPANCRARLTVENDDRPSMYHVEDLLKLHDMIKIPIVFDFHHHKFCPGEAGVWIRSMNASVAGELRTSLALLHGQGLLLVVETDMR
jgi:UV DNA damage endonuclease